MKLDSSTHGSRAYISNAKYAFQQNVKIEKKRIVFIHKLSQVFINKLSLYAGLNTQLSLYAGLYTQLSLYTSLYTHYELHLYTSLYIQTFSLYTKPCLKTVKHPTQNPTHFGRRLSRTPSCRVA